MKTLYERYKELKIDSELISLERREMDVPYFCYPTNAKPIGFEGCIMYCFIESYGDMVFASNPETCADICVYPLAKNFEDFLGLILTCGSANPIEQVVWMTKEKFMEHLDDEEERCSDKQKEILNLIENDLGVSRMDNPYEYVKELQANFDNSGIKYSDEYYDVLGIERE